MQDKVQHLPQHNSVQKDTYALCRMQLNTGSLTYEPSPTVSQQVLLLENEFFNQTYSRFLGQVLCAYHKARYGANFSGLHHSFLSCICRHCTVFPHEKNMWFLHYIKGLFFSMIPKYFKVCVNTTDSFAYQSKAIMFEEECGNYLTVLATLYNSLG